jgi:hypothetical protein
MDFSTRISTSLTESFSNRESGLIPASDGEARGPFEGDSWRPQFIALFVKLPNVYFVSEKFAMRILSASVEMAPSCTRRHDARGGVGWEDLRTKLLGGVDVNN